MSPRALSPDVPAVMNAFAALRLLAMSDRDKDVEILALRHQITILERQLGGNKVRSSSKGRAFLAALPAPLPRRVLHRLRLLIHPDTLLRWHRNLIKQRHARTCRPKRPGRPPTVCSIRILILRLVRDNPSRDTAGCTASSPRSASWPLPPRCGTFSNRKALTPPPTGRPRHGPISCAPNPTRYWPATSSRPSPSPGSANTSWPSSSTPPGTPASWAPPPTRPPSGPSRRDQKPRDGPRRHR